MISTRINTIWNTQDWRVLTALPQTGRRFERPRFRLTRSRKFNKVFTNGGVAEEKDKQNSKSQWELRAGRAIREHEADLLEEKLGLNDCDDSLTRALKVSGWSESMRSWCESECLNRHERDVMAAMLTMRELRPLEAKDDGHHQEAKQSELDNWTKNGVYEIVDRRKLSARTRLIDARWVLTNKEIRGGPRGEVTSIKRKARLVARGFWEQILGGGAGPGFTTDAPTTSRDSFYLLMAAAGKLRMDVSSLDAVTAFLQSAPGLEADRSVALEIPADARKMLKLGPNDVLLLRKAVYGLSDAPLRWFRTLDDVLVNRLGMTRSVLDPCLWHLQDPETGEIAMGVGAHVDDLLLVTANSKFVHGKMEILKASLKFTDLELPPFKYCGKLIRQRNAGSTEAHTSAEAMITSQQPGFTVDQGFYSQMVSLIDVPRHAQPEQECPHMKKDFQSLMGVLMWLCNSNPALNYRCSSLAGEVNCLTWGAVKRLNEAAKWIKSNVATLPYLASADKCDPRKMTIVCYTDASYQQERGCKTQGGFYICLTDRSKVGATQISDCHLLSWWSGRLKRVVQSTFQAESYAALEGWQRASYLSAMWAEVVLGHPPSHVGMSHPDSPNVVCFTDCASLATHMKSNRFIVSDRKFTATLGVLRQLLKEDRMECHHIRTQLMLADGLTKTMDGQAILQAIGTGAMARVAEEKGVRAPPVPALSVLCSTKSFWLTAFDLEKHVRSE